MYSAHLKHRQYGISSAKKTHQHRRSQIKLVEELGDEDVHFQDVGDILPLHITQHINEPFELTVRRANPQEIHL